MFDGCPVIIELLLNAVIAGEVLEIEISVHLRRGQGSFSPIQRYQLFKKLTAHSFDQFREVNIDEFDLNITEHIEELEEIDSSVSPLIYASYYGIVCTMKV